MKKFFVALFFAILLAVCIFDTVFTSKTFKTMINLTNAVHDEIEKTGLSNQTKKLAEKTTSFWDKKQKVLTIFIRHEEIKIIGEKLSLVKAYIDHDNLEDAQVEIHSLLNQIETIKGTYDFTFDNIL